VKPPLLSTRLKEHGFWDYTTPGAGGMEGYEGDDYARLLDDMSQAGMTSIVVMAKWLTTGYRSRLPFLDQHPDSPVTRSDNRLLSDFITAAVFRGIKVWLGAVVSMYPAAAVKGPPSMSFSGEFGGFPLSSPTGVFDSDAPEVTEYSVAIFEELLALFPGVHGFLVELEHCDIAMPHRAAAYDAWAKENRRPAFDQICRPIVPRNPDVAAWRDYATMSRLRVVSAVDTALRGRGFTGRLSLLCETGAHPFQVQQSMNLDMVKAALPDVACVSYDPNYDKTRNRQGIMEMAVEEPRRAGLESYYLPRGIMTWAGTWPMKLSLEEFWKVEQDDIRRYEPAGVWWFGSGYARGRPEGAHVSAARLRQSGYADSAAARAAFITALRAYRTTASAQAPKQTGLPTGSSKSER
jgi:hypothetical protein